MARPRKEIDEKKVQALAQIHCTLEEIAAVMECDVRTLTRRFAAVIRIGREAGKASLRRMQFSRARAGSDKMLIWLGKQLLGQRDKIENLPPPGQGGELSDEERQARIEELLAIAEGRKAKDTPAPAT